ncbi:MAG: PKD domain-containing protein [Saprospiraceae bacterium]|nr:PKD domain-containing protein [Saprospiraceae bacterium]
MNRFVPLLLLLFSLSYSVVQAQISITAADAPAVGDIFVQSADTLVNQFTVGESGPNRVWDFRNLVAASNDTLRFIAAGDAPKNEIFPDASFAGQIDSIYTFAQANDEGLFFLGIVSDFFDVDTFFALRFDPVPRLLAYPTTSTTAYVDTSKFDVSDFSDVFSDSVRITQEEFNHVTVDAFGTLRMPSGDFDVLRQERMVITFDTVEVRTNGVWFPLEADVDTIFTYEWLAKEAKGPVLTITTDAGGRITDVDFISNIIPNIPAPAAAFDIEDREDGSFRFVDRSTNEPLSWAWDFGDGNTSTEQNPIHTYTSVGTFNVCLTASNSTGSNTACREIEVFLPPAAAFDIDTIGNGNYAFNDLSTNSPLSWAWDFGDGSTSDQQNPAHTFNIPGTFNICLTVVNEVGENTVCQSLTVILIPVANFEIVDNGNGSFQFNDLSANNPDAWVWTFGDGDTSNDQSPSHSYAAPGSYEVCLTAANETGSTQACQMVTVVFAPVASFDIDTLDNGLYGFTDLSTNTPSSWAWDFGDGNTSTEQNPTHTFITAGTFNICLTATNAAGDNTACQSLTVVLSPQASFTATMGDNGNYSFTDQSTNDPTSWAWDFGDGFTSSDQNPTHTFGATGDFEVCLMATNAAGSSISCQTISVIINDVNDPALEAALTVFPNPVSDVLQIQLQDQGTEGAFLQIIGLNGQTQVRQAIQGQTTLQVRNWAAGHYTAILYASTGAIIGRKQFVVSR